MNSRPHLSAISENTKNYAITREAARAISGYYARQLWTDCRVLVIDPNRKRSRGVGVLQDWIRTCVYLK
jgi:hypothetical protein